MKHIQLIHLSTLVSRLSTLYFVVCTLYLLSSCQNVVEMPESYSSEQHLVMNSVITAGDPVHVSVSRSIFFLDYENNNSFPIVQDAEVIVKNTDETEVLRIDSTRQWYVSKNIIPAVGDSLTIIATDHKDTIYGSVVVPEKIGLKIDTTCVSRGFKWTLDYRYDSLGNYVYDSLGNEIRDTTGWDMRPLYNVTVSMKDPAEHRDGYLAAARHINEYADSTIAIGSQYPIAWQTYTTTTASNLILSQLGYNLTTSNFTSDYNLNGETLKFTFSSNFFVNNTSTAMSHQIKHVYLVVDVYHLSYEYYYFLYTANLSSNYSGNTSIFSLLGEPQHTYCNVSNLSADKPSGLGIIGVQTLTSDTLTLY